MEPPAAEEQTIDAAREPHREAAHAGGERLGALRLDDQCK